MQLCWHPQTEKFYDMLGSTSFLTLSLGSLLASRTQHPRKVGGCEGQDGSCFYTTAACCCCNAQWCMPGCSSTFLSSPTTGRQQVSFMLPLLPLSDQARCNRTAWQRTL